MQKLEKDDHTNAGEITVTGFSTGWIDLERWGNLYTRPYSREPQGFQVPEFSGITHANCTLPDRCWHMAGAHEDTDLHKQTQEWGKTLARCPKLKRARLRRELVDVQRQVQQKKNWMVTTDRGIATTQRGGSTEPPQTSASRNVDVGSTSATTSYPSHKPTPNSCPRASNIMTNDRITMSKSGPREACSKPRGKPSSPCLESCRHRELKRHVDRSLNSITIAHAYPNPAQRHPHLSPDAHTSSPDAHTSPETSTPHHGASTIDSMDQTSGPATQHTSSSRGPGSPSSNSNNRGRRRGEWQHARDREMGGQAKINILNMEHKTASD
ncbi:hypothetical protein GWK47_031813 [Chionoecetes opilio]|uniref:Uncharacterized protein n=1 Tax=Chionoecetes opilio TaxID=41210 RepID=A0A8J4YK77_CHIOP|nr:hypothetical protein GWK47_031813 [Chionoecetes opilio]